MKTKLKLKKKTIIILLCIIFTVLLITGICIHIYQSGRLTRALKAMDIEEKKTVTAVLELADDDVEILLDIADEYLDAKKSADAAAIAWHVLQNCESDNDKAKSILRAHYGKGDMASAVDTVKKTDTEFEIQSSHGGIGYGGTDGVYCSDFGGNIRYKISSVRAVTFSAAVGGVYVLDSADRCIKFISRDGTRKELIQKDVREFIYFESYIYYIGLDETVHGVRDITLGDGEIARGLRTFDHQVMCDIYDSKYNLLRTEILN